MEKVILLNGKEETINLIEANSHQVRFILNGNEYVFNNRGKVYQRLVLEHNQKSYSVKVASHHENKSSMNIFCQGEEFEIGLPSKGRSKMRGDEEGHMVSPMPGKIIKILVTEGEDVLKGTPLIIMEAMKMEHTIKSNCNGKVAKIYFKEEELVEGNAQLVEIEKGEE